ncbi:N-acetylmuramoyl-L-alanine amidase [Salegentibacter sp.]|uniref:N-acetylmuramoyl-L-alanine amidase n=1 Tax=Salegentibacter sp. TaxID=1903072 RepID=UPI003563C1D4
MKRGFALLNIILVLLVLASCASNPYSKTNRVYKKQAKAYAKQLSTFPLPEKSDGSALYYGEYRVGTTNFNLRKPNYVVLHHTAQDSVQQTLKTFTIPRTQVSSHYVIGRDGEVYHMLNDYFRGWHGGIGKWGNNSDLNSSSIGIELDNNGFEEFSLIQIYSLLEVLENLKEDYNIPAENFIGHSDIAPGRKVDPNATFPWKRLAEEGFGLWYDEEEVKNLKTEAEFFEPNPLVIAQNSILTQRIPFLDKILFPEVIPATFDVEMALRIIGFDTSNMDAALQSFKLHFIQEDIQSPLKGDELKILYNLYQKYL